MNIVFALVAFVVIASVCLGLGWFAGWIIVTYVLERPPKPKPMGQRIYEERERWKRESLERSQRQRTYRLEHELVDPPYDHPPECTRCSPDRSNLPF